MSFEIGDNNRPEGTQVLEEGIIHYTCNPPTEEALRLAGIKQLGKHFGVNENEVLLIPLECFENEGFLQTGIIEAEHLLRRLESE